MSSYGCRYVSWCVDPTESPAPAAAAPTGTATPERFPQSQQCTSSGSVPLLILPPETSGGEATSHHQCPSPTFPKTKHTLFTLHNTGKVPNVHSDEGIDDENTLTAPKGNLRQPEDDVQGEQEASLLHSEEGNFLLLRSSPVISRRHRTRCCRRGRTDPSTPSSSPPCASLPLHQHRCPTATGTKNVGSKQTSCRPPSPVQIDEKQHCVSLSSNLNSLLSGHLHSHNGQPGLAKDTKQRSLTTLPTLGPSTSALHNKESRGIPGFPANIYRTNCELEKENAHFIVVDMVLEVLEGAKWTLSCDQWTSMKDEHQHAECEMCSQRHTSSMQGDLPSKRTCTTQRHILDYSAGDPGESYRYRHSDDDMRTSNTDTHFSYGYQHTQGKEDEESVNEDTDDDAKTLSVVSTDSGFEDSGLNTERLTSTDSLRNAEWLAQQLVSEFKRNWFPSHGLQQGRKSLCSSLQELPGTEGVVVSSSSLAKEIRLRTMMRGSLNWAPPRFQIIFTVQPTHRRSDVVALQNFLCAGCGTEVEPRYIKKLRYCEYLGRYFCDCCHSGSEAVIPGRVLSGWDFSRYSVSDFSKQLLESVWHQPLFDLTRVGKTLYSRVKELDKLREIQEQLMGSKKLLTACRLSGRVLAEFDQLPAHFMEQPLLFSMDDLLRAKKGQLGAQTRAVLQSAFFHVQNCQLCQARGFICEFCREKDIIFPFQSDICKRCKVCKACFHKNCFLGKTCPKCRRIQYRMKVQMPP